MNKDSVSKEEKKKQLIAQILKFGVVGGLSFVIDFVITMLVSWICRRYLGTETAFALACHRYFGTDIPMDVATAAAVGGVFGFCISLVFNYFMSMKFVFERKDDMNRLVEFAIFTILSVIGLGINVAILYYGVIFCNWAFPVSEEYPSAVTAVVKMFATGVVMVYNFISRKMTLEKRREKNEEK